MPLHIFGDIRSGNCLKIRYVARHLNIPFTWEEVDILTGGSRTAAFLAMNPAGQVPTVILDDGRALAQSNAIMLHLAEGSSLIPTDPYERAKMFEWLFWEQYSHEPTVAVCRFQMTYLGKSREDLDPALVRKGNAALALMDSHLRQTQHAFLLPSGISLADVALVAYTRVADQGGFDLAAYPAVQAWISRVEGDLAIDA
jgi:glutathione S-transferase